jgi:cytochrome c oxidase subunit IV
MTTSKHSLSDLRACTRVWLLMLLLTGVTFAIGQQGLSGPGISLAVLFLALFKGYLVGAWFMGLNRVRGFWRWPVTLWLVIPGGLITAAFIMSY